ncbi:MAG: 4-alpha-glucanotransferase [Hespellia sp.]|nr:4-alpha-glucanotransferase [Hespellia sp.]
MRESGILLPISSLPSKYGIGCFSKEAFEFVDFLKAAGQKKWQILPLGPTGYGDSPYQSFSTFAGNPYYIDLEALIGWGLLTKKECDSYDFGKEEDCIDYEKMYVARFAILRAAFERFQESRSGEMYGQVHISANGDDEYGQFTSENAYWLEDYSLYMALKKQFNDRSWIKWEHPYRVREYSAMQRAREELREEMDFYKFQQYMFWKQWNSLHRYANERGIEIIGDIPIYVAFDSADAWANPLLFQFDSENRPLAVAGCPPDSFSPEGQLWGNPLYSWVYHQQTNYDWWIRRLAYCFELYDVVRLDHFRGFDEYYSIPAEDKTAENGHWEQGPGYDFIRVVKERLGHVRIIAEDLGFLTDSVRKLVSDSGYPGMKILQFAFDSREESNYLPTHYDRNCVVYTGTHDNDTIAGWYEQLGPADREMALEYMNAYHFEDEEMPVEFIRLAMASVADLCVIPMQDYLGLGSEARINKPSTVGKNWKWRLLPGQVTDAAADVIARMTRIYGR